MLPQNLANFSVKFFSILQKCFHPVLGEKKRGKTSHSTANNSTPIQFSTLQRVHTHNEGPDLTQTNIKKELSFSDAPPLPPTTAKNRPMTKAAEGTFVYLPHTRCNRGEFMRREKEKCREYIKVEYWIREPPNLFCPYLRSGEGGKRIPPRTIKRKVWNSSDIKRKPNFRVGKRCYVGDFNAFFVSSCTFLKLFFLWELVWCMAVFLCFRNMTSSPQNELTPQEKKPTK